MNHLMKQFGKIRDNLTVIAVAALLGGGTASTLVPTARIQTDDLLLHHRARREKLLRDECVAPE